jgi:AbrB family looped-hinge helix DNA binding protein
MARTRLSSKGQVIIPKAVRERHGWQPGVELEVEDRGDVVVLRPVRLFPPTTIVSALRPFLRSGSGAIPLPWRGDPE